MKYCPECRAELETRLMGGAERKVCSAPDCRFVAWDNPVPVVAGLVVYQDKLLLARNSAWPRDIFSMITGYLERNESPQEAIIRETGEELGLQASRAEFIGHYPFTAKNQIIMAFAVQAEGEISLNEELSEFQLLDMEQVRQKDFGRLYITAQVVNDWLSGM